MDPLTHALTSYAIYRVACPRESRLAAPLLITAGVLPDLDTLSFLGGPRAFVIYDGALTHSLPGAALLACALGVAFFLLGRKSKSSPCRWRWRSDLQGLELRRTCCSISAARLPCAFSGLSASINSAGILFP